MTDIKWIKISTGLFDDEAIQVILDFPDGAVMLEIWLRLLILAGKINDNGLIYFKDNFPYTTDFLATIFHKKNRQIELALKTFSKFNMIKILNNQQILIENWEKYQNIEGLETVREKNRIRKQRQREREKILMLENKKCHVTECDMSRDVTEQNKNKNKNIDINSSSTCTTTENFENCHGTISYSEDGKLYGEFGNVYLNNAQYQKLLGITLSEKLLNQLIEDFSCAIAEGKEEDYRADKPDAHFVRLRKYYDWRKTHPKTDIQSGGFKTKNQEIQEVQDEVDRVIEELKKKEQENGTK